MFFFYSTKYYAIFLQISKLFRNFAAIVDISQGLTPNPSPSLSSVALRHLLSSRGGVEGSLAMIK